MYSTGFNSKCKSCVKEERESKPKVKYITRAELEEENKKLKEDVERLIKLSEHKTATIIGLGKNLDGVKEENKNLKEENEKLHDEFMLKLAEAFLLPPTSNQMAEYKKRNFSKWYDEIKNQMRKEIKEGK